MSRSTLFKGAASVALLLTCVEVRAAVPYGPIDPRSFAMGGTGVASGEAGNAGLVNPALLAVAREDEDFALEFPMLYGRLSDPDDVIDAADQFDSVGYVGKFRDSVDNFNAVVASVAQPSDWLDPVNQERLNSAKAEVVAASYDLIDGLNSLSGKPLLGEGVGAVVIGIPSETFGMSFQLAVRGAGGGVGVFSEEDQNYFENEILAPLDAIDFTDPNTITALENLADPANANQLTSNLQTRFAVVAEVGVSFSREITIAGSKVGIGVTPKYVEVAVYHFGYFSSELDQAEFVLGDGEKRYSDFNIDFGLAKEFGNGWKAGFFVSNLISREYETSPNTPRLAPAIIKIGPQARVGVSHQTEWVSVAFDIDLNASDPVGFESQTQYASIGAELDLWDTVQVRIGYRHNLKDSDTSVPTVGIGFSPFGVHVDLAAAANDNEVAVSGQLGFRF